MVMQQVQTHRFLVIAVVASGTRRGGGGGEVVIDFQVAASGCYSAGPSPGNNSNSQLKLTQ